MSQTKQYKLTDSTFDCPVIICVGTPIRALAKYLEKDKSIYGQHVEVEVPGRVRNRYYVWLRTWKNTPFWNSVLVHELFHHTRFIMEFLDADLCDKNEEVWACYLDSMVRQALMKLNREGEGR